MDLVEPTEHSGVDLEHGTANTGVFMLAGGGVGACTVPELDFPFVEVFFEFSPFRIGWRFVFPGWTRGAPLGEVFLVVPDHVFAEDGDVAVGCLDIEVSQECGADMDRQTVIDQVRGQKAAEVVRCEAATTQLGMIDGDGVAEFGQFITKRSGVDHFSALSDGALEEERQRLASDSVVGIESSRQWHAFPVPGQASNDRGDDVEKVRAHGYDSFPIIF